MLWIKVSDDGHGPGIGSLRRPLKHLLVGKRAACQSHCDALGARLLTWKPVWVAPGPKSGPRF